MICRRKRVLGPQTPDGRAVVSAEYLPRLHQSRENATFVCIGVLGALPRWARFGGLGSPPTAGGAEEKGDEDAKYRSRGGKLHHPCRTGALRMSARLVGHAPLRQRVDVSRPSGGGKHAER